MKQVQSENVREFFAVDNDKMVIVTNDMISISKKLLPNVFDGKGKMQSQIAEYWFGKTKDIVQNHFITSELRKMPEEFQALKYDGRIMLVKKLVMIPVRIIARKYLTGDALKTYRRNGTVAGTQLQKGYKESQELPYLFLTYYIREAGKKDYEITPEMLDTIVERLYKKNNFNLNGVRPSFEIYDKAKKLYFYCSREAEKRGITLADMKLEFGIDHDGNLVLADDLMTPDSCRLWPSNEIVLGKTPESWDKQYIKQYLLKNGWTQNQKLPVLNDEIVQEICERYRYVYKEFLGKEFVA